MKHQNSSVCFIHFAWCKTDQVMQNRLVKNAYGSIHCCAVARRDPKALAEKLSLLSDNPELRKSFALAGMDRVRNLFTIEKQLDAWEAFYRKML